MMTVIEHLNLSSHRPCVKHALNRLRNPCVHIECHLGLSDLDVRNLRNFQDMWSQPGAKLEAHMARVSASSCFEKGFHSLVGRLRRILMTDMSTARFWVEWKVVSNAFHMSSWVAIGAPFMGCLRPR